KREDGKGLFLALFGMTARAIAGVPFAAGRIELVEDGLKVFTRGDCFGPRIGGNKFFFERGASHVEQVALLIQLPLLVSHIPVFAQFDKDPIARMRGLAAEFGSETSAINRYF